MIPWCRGGLRCQRGVRVIVVFRGPYSPQTFASGRGPGSGRECWTRVTVWVAASPTSLSAVRRPFASRRLSARGSKQDKRLISHRATH